MRLIDINDIQSRVLSVDQVPILQLDVTGTPQNWISARTAANLLFTGDIAWSAGGTAVDMRGGFSRLHQRFSHLEVPAIVATKGHGAAKTMSAVPPLTNGNVKLFARDRYMCAYCGTVHRPSELTREHIIPVSQKGPNVWMNVVAACKPCNNRKGARTPEQAHMQLLYLPYEPNLFEDFILRQRHILADQMDYLMARVPDGSRMRLA
jgi:hypothetical protein